MKNTLYKTAALISFTIGLMSVVSGGRVLEGWKPGYSVLSWLPVYNFVMGVLTVLIPSVLIWRRSRFASLSAVGTFALHLAVFLALVTLFKDKAAAESVNAMLFRLGTWVVILFLLFFARREEKLKLVKNHG